MRLLVPLSVRLPVRPFRRKKEASTGMLRLFNAPALGPVRASDRQRIDRSSVRHRRDNEAEKLIPNIQIHFDLVYFSCDGRFSDNNRARIK